MKGISTLLLVFGLVQGATATVTNLITNGSFESGTNGWILFGGVAKYSVTNAAFSGTNGLKVVSRPSFAIAPQQDVTTQLAAATNGGLWVTRLAVQLSAPTMVRAWLAITTDNAGTVATNRLLLAEEVVRVTNTWERIDGVKTIAWPGVLSNALFYLECGMAADAVSNQFPNAVFDAIETRPDDDGDFLANTEEVPGVFGTLPDNRDSDGDGIPDGWEVFNGTGATTNDAAADPDHDSASNWQEYWAATSPTNALSYPGRPRISGLSRDAQAVLTYLAKLPAATSNRVIVGQHVTDIEKDWSNYVARLPVVTGKWPGIVSFAAEGGALAVPQMGFVVPRALEVWTNGGIPLIKWQIANPWTNSGTAVSTNSLENLPDLLRLAPTNAADVAARSNYLALRNNIATNLAVLRDAGVVVLFRPLSEMNGAWFWHGNKRRTDYLALWRDLHDYFTFTCGLTNMLWVYESDAALAHLISGMASSSGTMVDYYFPGDDLVDIAGHNVYDDDWKLNFDSDTIWRRYGKVLAVPQAGKGNGQAANPNWSNLTYLDGVSNTLPRCSFFCVWNSYTNGTPVLHAITDNAQAYELMNAAWSVTRDEVNWRYELPFAMSLDLLGAAQLRVNWQGGALQHSTDLASWTNVPNAAQPYLHDLNSAPRGFWRLKR